MDPLDAGLREVERERAIAAALEARVPRLEKKPNFAGIGVGHARTGGKVGRGLAAVIFVTRKVPIEELDPSDRMPRSIRVGSRRVRTDVVVLSGFEPHQYRPMQMGCSIQACVHNQNVPAAPMGTAGAVVEEIVSGERRLLSAGHVFSAVDEDVIQPSIMFGGQNRVPPAAGQPPDPKDNVGSVRRVASGGIDGAIAETSAAVPDVISFGPPTGTYWPLVDMPVRKHGALTGATEGTVVYSNAKAFTAIAKWWLATQPQVFTGSPAHQPVPAPGAAQMPGLFLVEPGSFSIPGDSGSLIMAGPPGSLQTWADRRLAGLPQADRTRYAQALENRAVGLLIGGSAKQTVGQDIDTILDALSVTLVT